MRMRGVMGMLAVCAALAACKAAPAASGPVTADADPTQRTYGMNLKLTENGILKADLYGDTAFTQPNTEVTELKGVKLTFFDSEGKKPGKLTSRTGEYDARTGIMIARGNVVLITQNDKGQERVIKSEELYYDQRGDRVWSERETIIDEAGRHAVTDGFTSDTRFTNMRGTNAKSTGIRVNAGEGGL
ncbi:MAG TPA: LPS export ABC transporter periplasmic protein LptC [Longimicrobium sp.]|nr:LPS export ABC transporter periplasmic protein LptC [Longimicrobium sp.]